VSFDGFAHQTAQLAGKPATFAFACAIVAAWAISGPMFGYSDTWQLLINTATTISTGLMVFLLQATQNRDTKALQAKIDEMIRANPEARDCMQRIEDLPEAEIEARRHGDDK
jgi:low affinity Fe/Cu permease